MFHPQRLVYLGALTVVSWCSQGYAEEAIESPFPSERGNDEVEEDGGQREDDDSGDTSSGTFADEHDAAIVRAQLHFRHGVQLVHREHWEAALAEFDATATASVAGGSVSTPLIVSDIEFAGVNGTQYFDSAQQHRLWRRDRFHNIEVNLIRSQMLGMPGGQMNINWLGGMRYGQFGQAPQGWSYTGGQFTGPQAPPPQTIAQPYTPPQAVAPPQQQFGPGR